MEVQLQLVDLHTAKYTANSFVPTLLSCEGRRPRQDDPEVGAWGLVPRRLPLLPLLIPKRSGCWNTSGQFSPSFRQETSTLNTKYMACGVYSTAAKRCSAPRVPETEHSTTISNYRSSARLLGLVFVWKSSVSEWTSCLPWRDFAGSPPVFCTDVLSSTSVRASPDRYARGIRAIAIVSALRDMHAMIGISFPNKLHGHP